MIDFPGLFGFSGFFSLFGCKRDKPNQPNEPDKPTYSILTGKTQSPYLICYCFREKNYDIKLLRRIYV